MLSQCAGLYAIRPVGFCHQQNDLVSSYSEGELELLADFFQKAKAMWEEKQRKLQENN